MPAPRPSLADPPDPRLIQANERTFLAWIRTGLALITFGFVISRLGSWIAALQPHAGAPEGDGLAPVFGAGFLWIGIAANILALTRYVRARRALVRGEPVGLDVVPIVFGALVTALGVLLGLYVARR